MVDLLGHHGWKMIGETNVPLYIVIVSKSLVIQNPPVIPNGRIDVKGIPNP